MCTKTGKQRFLKVCVWLFCLLLPTSNVFAKASHCPGVFFYNEYGSPAFETINDWVSIGGSSGYQSYFTLNSQTACTENAVDTQDMKTYLHFSATGTVWVPAGTWAGYQFTVPNGNLSPNEDIIQWYTAGYFQFPPTTELRLTDTSGNVLWTYTTGGWIASGSTVFLPKETVRLIIYQREAAYVWAGNIALSSQRYLYTKPRWFGFYAVDTLYALGNLDSNALGYCSIAEGVTNLDTVYPYSNIAEIDLGKYTTNAQIDAVAEHYKAHGVHMLVDVGNYLINWGNNAMRTDIDETWGAWIPLRAKIDLIRQHNTADFDVIGGFYLADEPYWNCMLRDGGVYYQPSHTSLKWAMYTATNEIKEWYSNPVMIVEAPAMFEDPYYSYLDIPSNIDWVGFDKYLSANDGENFNSVIAGFYLPRLKYLLNNVNGTNQKIVLVPECTIGSSMVVPIPSDSQIRYWASQYDTLLRNDPQIIGIIGFRYPGLHWNQYYDGLPDTLSWYESVGGSAYYK